MDDKWFKAQQKKAGVTAEDIAKRMGRNRSAVSHIYTGHRRMSLEWAQAFSDVLKVPLDEVLKHAGVLDEQKAQRLTPGFSESDAVPFVGKSGHEAKTRERAALFGGGKPGVDVWTVMSKTLMFEGYIPGDFILLDTHQSERCKPGDVVIAQKYDWQGGGASALLRRFEPPVLVAAGPDRADRQVHVVDGTNVVIMGKIIASWRAP